MTTALRPWPLTERPGRLLAALGPLSEGDPEPSPAMLLMRERLTSLRALYVTEAAGRGSARKALALMTREQVAAAILERRERGRPGGEQG